MADINYDDERFTQVEEAKQQALTENEQIYGGMINEAQQYYQAQIDASKEWANKQSSLQQENTDFTIEQIEQQKEQTKKDYTKEQSGAYADWQKESNKYGVNAEELAAGGLAGTGYGESSQVRMYNTYQNRVVTARESYNLAILNYNNAIKEAQLQNNSALAEIAYTALQQQLELSLAGFQYENELVLAQANQKTQIENTYYNRYQDVLNQMNTENALAEQARQYNQNYELQMKEYEEGVRQFNEQLERLKEQDAQENMRAIQELELKKAQLEEEKRQFDIEAGQTSANGKSGSSVTGRFLSSGVLTDAKNVADAAAAQINKSKTTTSSVPGKLLDNAVKEINEKLEKSTTANESTKRNSTTGSAGTTKTESTGAYEFGTPYYRGSYNPDREVYGTFSNGYQPKGISGHGRLSKTGDTEEVTTVIQYGANAGKKQVLRQNIWIAEDGTKWLWNGVKNSYQEYKE